jgi:hypothetical protein
MAGLRRRKGPADEAGVSVRIVGRGGERRAETEGLRARGHPELVLRLHGSPDPRGDAGAVELLRDLARYLEESGRTIRPGERMAMGWAVLGFAETGGALAVQETVDPYGGQEQGFSDGAARSIRVKLAQDDVMRRNRLEGTAEHPHPGETAVVCTRVPHGSPRPLFLERGRRQAPADCGWVVCCTDRDHDHEDGDTLSAAHLGHLVEEYPALLPYLAAPVGTAFALEADHVVVFPPGRDDGRLDPDPQLAWRP